MAVSHILKQKGRTVLTVTPMASVKEVAGILSKNRIGAVVVKRMGLLPASYRSAISCAHLPNMAPMS